MNKPPTEHSLPSASRGWSGATVFREAWVWRRFPPGWALWGLVLAIAFAALAFSRNSSAVRGNPPLPAGYVLLARHLADGCSASPDAPEPVQPPSQVIAQLRLIAVELEGIAAEDAELKALAQEVQAIAAGASVHLERLATIPGSPELLGWFAENFIRGLLLDFSGALDRSREVEGNREAAEAEARSLLIASRRWDSSKLFLPRVAARYAGPPAPKGRAISIDLDAAWGAFGPGDRLTLTNFAVTVIHNCTILVELHGEGGDIARNVYFVPLWGAGAAIYARCPAGVEILGETVGRGTVPRVESITLSAWSDELTFEAVTYDYAGAERDFDVERYCQDMKVEASYRPFAKGLFWDTERGVVVRLKGLKFAPKPRITVSFHRRGSDLPVYWDFDRWDEGEEKTLDTGGRLPWDPEGYVVTVGFPGTTYKHRTNWVAR